MYAQIVCGISNPPTFSRVALTILMIKGFVKKENLYTNRHTEKSKNWDS